VVENNGLRFKKYYCFSCYSNNSTDTKYFKKAFEHQFKILRCKTCFTQYIDKIPEDIKTYTHIYDHGGRDSKVDLNSIFTKLRIYKAKKYIAKHCSEYLFDGKKILDYGSGDGYLSYTFNLVNQNLKVYATDYLYYENEFYRKVQFINLDDIYSKDEKYDLIVLRHVLEHIEDPFKIIKKLLTLLEPEGCIMVEVPNHDIKTNTLLKIFGTHYSQIGMPWHFNHLNSADFEKNLTQNRLKFSKNSIPVLGQSISMVLFQNKIFFDNTGLLALLFYPFQVLIDSITSSFTALVVRIYNK
tara:strand:- start:784 stop:1677 length:894 start_codon:yes stop_codon:yes gene_type:complete